MLDADPAARPATASAATPRRTCCASTSARAIDGAPPATRELVPHFRAVEQARGDVTLTYFEFTTLVVLAWFAQRAPGRGDPRSRPGRAPRRGQHRRRRLRDRDDHRPGPHGTAGLDTRAHRLEKAAHLPRRDGRPSASNPIRRAACCDHAAAIGADLWRFGRDLRRRAGGTGAAPVELSRPARRPARAAMAGVARRAPDAQRRRRARGARGAGAACCRSTRVPCAAAWPGCSWPAASR